MNTPRVLVTGAAGYLGSRLAQDLPDRGFSVRLTDLAEEEGRDGVEASCLRPLNLLHDDPASDGIFSDIDVIVHAATKRPASDRSGQGTANEDRFAVELDNLRMAQCLMSKALKAGIRRVVLLSSNHSTDWYETSKDLLTGRLTPNCFPASVDFYGWARSAIELLTIPYSVGTFGQEIEVITLRIGAPRELTHGDYMVCDAEGVPVDVDRPRLHRDLGAFLSRRDFVQLVGLSISAPRVRGQNGLPWVVAYGISENTRAFWSLDTARYHLGYRPHDDSESRFSELIHAAGLSQAGGGAKMSTEDSPAW